MLAVPFDTDAYRLMHHGAQALAKVEGTGLRVDTKYLKKTIGETEQSITEKKQAREDSEIGALWRKTYGRKTNFGSNAQLGDILFRKLGYNAVELTATGKPSTDEKALSAIPEPFVKDYLEIKKLEKALKTYLRGIEREVVRGKIHPMFSLHIPRTFRSSSERPNFQNMPIRDPEMGRLIRSCFIARPGSHLVEVDYSGIEVRVAACYHKDPSMLSYIEDESKDMHRDMAMECYQLTSKQVTKAIRYCGKNMFVFPQFYGDWYIDCARNLWNAIDSMDLKTADGVGLKKHLESKGIRRLGDLDPNSKPPKGTFEHHIKKTEDRFWNHSFPVYNGWKKQWYNQYRRRGWLRMKTGFVCQGLMKRNEVINYPVQGAAFHCLLWSLVRMVNTETSRHSMRSRIVGQIHDSLVADVLAEELDDYLVLLNRVMTMDLRREWEWIITPLEIEAEVSPVGGSWAEKKEMEIPT
jgi:DNA polymerase I-like protein with 3'-5' exonuclease and polymerase domains